MCVCVGGGGGGSQNGSAFPQRLGQKLKFWLTIHWMNSCGYGKCFGLKCVESGFHELKFLTWRFTIYPA